METESGREGWIQKLHPLCKLIVTIAYIAVLVSFHKYNLSGVLLMGIYPVIMFITGDIPVRLLFRRMRVLMIMVCIIGAFNPLFDRNIVMTVGSVDVSGGVVSMVTLVLKGVFAISAAYLLMVTTGLDNLCRALAKIHIPRTVVTVIMLLFRYIPVSLEEAGRVTEACSLRSPAHRGVSFKAWGSLAGQMLLRSTGRARMVYESMMLRGYDGDSYLEYDGKAGITDYLFCLVCLAVFIIIRIVLK